MLNVCTHDCKSLWIKASAKWHIFFLYIYIYLSECIVNVWIPLLFCSMPGEKRTWTLQERWEIKLCCVCLQSYEPLSGTALVHLVCKRWLLLLLFVFCYRLVPKTYRSSAGRAWRYCDVQPCSPTFWNQPLLLIMLWRGAARGRWPEEIHH
jgi:hypothetical protein